jgi:chemotaxis signal transduction protein
MSKQAISALQTADQMREAFDHGFALPVQDQSEAWEDFLLIRLGQRPHAVPMSEVSGLLRADGITPLPGPLPALLGIAGHKGRILPVYDLAILLSLPPTQGPKWQIVTRTSAVILAVDEFERHVRCPAGAIARPTDTDEADTAHIRDHLHTEEGQRPIVSLAAVLRTIQNMTRTARQER